MPKQQITIEVDVPEGYELTGEFRIPVNDDSFIHQAKCEHWKANDLVLNHESLGRRFILRKKWTPAPYLPQCYWLWIWSTSKEWFISKQEPMMFGNDYANDCNNGHLALKAKDYAKFHGMEFVPPTGTNCIQIDHT